MTTLREYLDTTKADKGLKDLIEVIADQGDFIRKAFITNQKYVDTKNIYGETQIELDKWSNDHLKKVLVLAMRWSRVAGANFFRWTAHPCRSCTVMAAASSSFSEGRYVTRSFSAVRYILSVLS